MFITTSEFCSFGIGFGIGRKYRPITVLVSVSGRNQNGGFGRSLIWVPIKEIRKIEKTRLKICEIYIFRNLSWEKHWFLHLICFYFYGDCMHKIISIKFKKYFLSVETRNKWKPVNFKILVCWNQSKSHDFFPALSNFFSNIYRFLYQ